MAKAEIEIPTPVTLLWDNILMLPIVGMIDSKRGQEIMETMLDKVLATESKVIVLDILGVAVVDSAVAKHILQITKATALMGATTIVSGISPAIAQTLVSLGIDMGSVDTTATLKDAVYRAFDMVGLEVVKKK